MSIEEQNPSPSWIAVDWGTTHLRAWAMSKDNQVLDHLQSAQGMGGLAQNEFEPALMTLIQDWLPQAAINRELSFPVMACGMVGARQGWKEAPYRSVPCQALGNEYTTLTTKAGLTVSITAGLMQAAPADVMRGEETQIAGFLQDYPDYSGSLCMPGSHTKWVMIQEGKIASFQTFMTGETFAALSSHTVLRHSVSGQFDIDSRDEASFLSGITDSLADPSAFAGKLFSLRAEGLLNDMQPTQASARLSGLLIGLELAATKTYWENQPVGIIGTDRLSSLYSKALRSQACDPQAFDGQDCALKGLISAYESQKELA